MHSHYYRRAISSDLPRHNINVIDILLRTSIKEKHRGWMKYAAFRGARAFQLELPPSEYVRRNTRKKEKVQCGGSTRAGGGGMKRNKMEKREIRPRKFNDGRGRNMRRDEAATWRQSHGSGSHKCNAEVTGLQSDHLTVPQDRVR